MFVDKAEKVIGLTFFTIDLALAPSRAASSLLKGTAHILKGYATMPDRIDHRLGKLEDEISELKERLVNEEIPGLRSEVAEFKEEHVEVMESFSAKLEGITSELSNIGRISLWRMIRGQTLFEQSSAVARLKDGQIIDGV